ncbi:hypothetical protein GOODEAATRI_010520 [Goodea atripinnis]|uniref:Uncharacterized protein n=1 Tax=Goodea atripinnis TaxID=208336 RepID=A0ABV0N096_9TELE
MKTKMAAGEELLEMLPTTALEGVMIGQSLLSMTVGQAPGEDTSVEDLLVEEIAAGWRTPEKMTGPSPPHPMSVWKSKGHSAHGWKQS